MTTTPTLLGIAIIICITSLVLLVWDASRARSGQAGHIDTSDGISKSEASLAGKALAAARRNVKHETWNVKHGIQQ